MNNVRKELMGLWEHYNGTEPFITAGIKMVDEETADIEVKAFHNFRQARDHCVNDGKVIGIVGREKVWLHNEVV